MVRTRLLSVLLAVLLVAGLCAATRAQWVKDGVSLCGATGWQVSSAIVADDSGGAVVIWRDNRGGADYDIYGNRINASGHVMGPSAGVAVCVAPGDQADFHLIPDGTGGAIVVWRDSRSGYKVYGQRIDGTGVARWATNGISLCGTGGYQVNPRIVPDGTGGALVAWSDSRSGNYDIYVQHVDAAGNLLLGANGTSMCVEPGDQHAQDMTADGTGGAIIVWIDNRGTSADIYAQRFNSDGDALWTTNGVAVCVEDGNQSYPSAVPSGGGGAIIVWQSTNAVTTFDAVYAQRFDAGGGVLWDPAGIIACSSWDHTSYPRAVTDGADGAIVAWYDFRGSGEPDVYVQRIDATGRTDLWGTCGVVAFSTGGESGIRRLLADHMLRPADCLIAEPTPARHPSIGQKGLCRLGIEFTGVPAHGSLYPAVGVSAIMEAMELLGYVKGLHGREFPVDDHLKEIIARSSRVLEQEFKIHDVSDILKKLSFNPGIIKGGEKSNVVAQQCTLELELRVPWGCPMGSLIADISAQARNGKVVVEETNDPSITDPSCPLVTITCDEVHKVWSGSVFPIVQWAASDARHLRLHGFNVIQYGPGEIKSLHAVDERVTIGSLEKASRIYHGVMERYMSA